MIYIPVIISEVFIFTYWILNIGGNSMSDHTLNIILAVAAIIGPILTFILSRKSQISKNTEEIKNLARQLGVNDEKTFHAEFSEQYSTIITNIGKSPDDRTLTGQHNDILKVIEQDFEKINSRYEKEDKSYRSFTMQQKDIKETLDNFSKDYAKVIAHNQKLYYENCELREKYDNVLEENQELKSQLGITVPNNPRKPKI